MPEPNVQENINKLVARLAEIEPHIGELAQGATDHEKTAREMRNQRDELKREAETIRKTLGHAQVIQATQNAAEAALRSQKEAEESAKAQKEQADKSAKDQEEVLARLLDKEKKLDELIAKAQAATSPGE